MSIDHHACLIKLSTLSVEEALSYYGSTENLEIRKLSYSTISISDVRGIIDVANLRPGSGDKALLIISALSINFEAQQALLKILEEPPVSTRFLFVLKDNFSLLPTLASRFFTLQPKIGELITPVSFTQFFQANYAERFEMISKKMLKKDLLWIEEIRQGLKAYVENLVVMTQNEKKLLFTFGFVLEQLTMRGAANKMLLEELALSLPYRAQK